MADAPNILLVRLDGLGDALACVPLLEGVRQALPLARFAAVCSRANAALYSRERMSAIYTYDGFESEVAMIGELRAGRYTHAIVATEEPIGYRVAKQSGAERRIGFWHRFEKTFKSLWQFAQLTDAVYRPAAWVARPEHEVEAIYSLAERIGASRPVPTDASRLRSWIDASPEGALPSGDDTIAYQISSKLTSGGWGPAAIAGFVAASYEESGFARCTLLSSPSDEGLARAVMEQLPGSVRASGRAAIAPPMSLPNWLGAIASAKALVTPDTGAAHAAGMLGVPVVDLFDGERFEQLSRQWRPWAAPSRCLLKPRYHTGIELSLAKEAGAAAAALAGRSERIT